VTTILQKLTKVRQDKLLSKLAKIRKEESKGDTGKTGEQGLQGIQGLKGLDGETGRSGRDGLDGKQGKDGRDGKDGKDGVTTVITKEVIADVSELLEELEELKDAYERLNNNVKGGVHGFGIPDAQIKDIIDARLDELVYDKLIDEDGNYTYLGEADAGSSKSSPLWRIRRIDSTNDPDVEILWADGTTEFTKTWDNRASYTY